MIVLELRKKPGFVDKLGTPLSMRTPTLLAIYSFRFMPGSPSIGDAIPAAAPCLDTVPYGSVGADGMLRMVGDDGSTVVAGKVTGSDGKAAFVQPTTSGFATTSTAGEVALDYTALKLTVAPWIDAEVVGAKPARVRLKAVPTPTAAVLVVTEDKPAVLSTLNVTVAVSGGQPSPGTVIRYRVTGMEPTP